MADLSHRDKRILENIFGMGSGYVLDFSNRTFEEFFFDEFDIDIYNEKYNYYSGSKANRLRGFWTEESDFVVGKVITGLLDHYKYLTEANDYNKENWNEDLYQRCLKIVDRLCKNVPVEDIDAFEKITGDNDFDKLAKIVKECIEKNEPATGLDRLHTYVVKYIRKLCEHHSIESNKGEPLHSLFGKYVKHLKKSDKINSEMTERILKSSISVLDAFNDIRNNKSYAHDNPLLEYRESLLIFRNVSSSIKFIDSIEDLNTENKKNKEIELEDIPF